MKKIIFRDRESNLKHLFKYLIILQKRDLVAIKIVSLKIINLLDKLFNRKNLKNKVYYSHLGRKIREEIIIRMARCCAKFRVIEI